MKKFRYLVATLMIAAIVAVVLVGCKKEKSNETQSNNGDATEEVVRKPIAVLNNQTGQITYLVGIDQLQKGLDEYTASKDLDGFVVESWEIMCGGNDSIPLTLRFTILNIESETSESIFLVQSFIITEKIGDECYFYLSPDVDSGNFEFVAFSEQGQLNQLVTIRNYEVFCIEEWNGISKDQCGYYVKCIGKNCKSGCELIMTSHTYECSECKPYASAGNNWSCTREEGTGSGYASVLGVLSSI